MERSEVFERLNQVFCEVFDDDAITVTEETTAADVAGWDSLMHITLIAEVEEEFDMKFPMKSVGDMVDVILEADE